MPKATTNVVIFKPPVYKAYNQMTVEEKNTNLEFFADLLCDYLGLEVFDNLTDVNATYGNAYYLGFNNASHASLCIFYPHQNYSTSLRGIISIESVDDQNIPITSGSKYSRKDPDAYGYCGYGYSDRTDYWAFVSTKNEDAFYLQYFAMLTKDTYTGATTPVNAINTVLYNTEYGMVSTDTSYCKGIPGFFVSKTLPYYLHYHTNNHEIYFLNSPISQRTADTQWPGAGLNMSEVCRYFADMDKKYYADKLTLKNSGNIPYELEYPTNSPFKALFGYNLDTVISAVRHNSIFKMDDKYYLVIRKFNNSAICAWEIGDQWEQITTVLS